MIHRFIINATPFYWSGDQTVHWVQLIHAYPFYHNQIALWSRTEYAGFGKDGVVW